MKQFFIGASRLFAFLFFTAITTATTATAQTADRSSAPNFYKTSLSADLNLATDGKNGLVALAGNYLWGVGKPKRFKIGTGLRLNYNFGANTKFLTAPAILTTGKTGPIVFFDGTKLAQNIDTLQTSSFNVTSINIPLYLEYAITNRLDIGFNIDLTGLSFGKSTHNYNSVHSTAANRGPINGTATSFNALLVGDNDLGSLNSELLARYHINEKLAINAGLSFVFAEFTSSQKLYLDNDRFRQKQLLFMVGAKYSFGR